MANNFKRKTSRGIGTVATTIGSYTPAANTQVTVIGLSAANITTSPISVTFSHHNGADVTTIVKDATIPAGGALVVVGGDQKMVLEPGDIISVTSSAASSVDAIMSILEIT
jgi:hypothetical protein